MENRGLRILEFDTPYSLKEQPKWLLFLPLKCEGCRGVEGARIGVDVARRLAVIDVFVRQLISLKTRRFVGVIYNVA